MFKIELKYTFKSGYTFISEAMFHFGIVEFNSETLNECVSNSAGHLSLQFVLFIKFQITPGPKLYTKFSLVLLASHIALQ